MTPGPASSEAKHIFSVAHRQHVFSMYVYKIHSWPPDQHRKRSTSTSTKSTNGLILVSFLDCQAECLLVANTCVYMVWIFPVTGFRHLFYPETGSGSIYPPLPLTRTHSCSATHPPTPFPPTTPLVFQQLTWVPLFLQQPTPSVASLRQSALSLVPRSNCQFAG